MTVFTVTFIYSAMLCVLGVSESAASAKRGVLIN